MAHDVGANYLLESGTPLSTVADEKGMAFFPYGRGDLGRTPVVLAAGPARAAGSAAAARHAAGAGVDAINLFDQDTETGYYTRPYRDGFNLDDQVFFAGFDPEAVVAATPGFARDARYGLANASRAAARSGCRRGSRSDRQTAIGSIWRSEALDDADACGAVGFAAERLLFDGEAKQRGLRRRRTARRRASRGCARGRRRAQPGRRRSCRIRRRTESRQMDRA